MRIIADEPSGGRALRNAGFAALIGAAASKAAERLVDALYARVAADQRKHTKSQANENKLRKAIAAFLADLLVAHAGGRPRKWVWRTMSPRGYTGGPVGYDVFVKRLVPSLQRLELLECRQSVAQYIEGFNNSTEVSAGSHEKTVRVNQWATRFRARQELLEISTRHGVPPENADQHFEFDLPLPREPLQVRTASTRPHYGGEKLRGTKMAFTQSSSSRRLEQEIRELNKYLNLQRIEGGKHAKIRTFQNGDQKAFRWNFDGRLYAAPTGNNYHS